MSPARRSGADSDRQYYTSLSVPVTLGSVTDGGSSPKASSFTVQRDTIGLAAGNCGAFTGSWSTVTLSAGNDSTVSSGNCYRYREIAADNVGNSTTSGISNTAKVDTSAPSTPGLTFSGLSANAYWNSGSSTFYFRASAGGTFKIRNAVSDAASGPASSQTTALGGTTRLDAHWLNRLPADGRRTTRMTSAGRRARALHRRKT
jgi:hypothetical protein